MFPTPRPRAPLHALLAVLLIACSADRIGQPDKQIQVASGVRLPELLDSRFAISRNNICEEEQIARDGAGRYVGWKNLVTKAVDVRPAAKDTSFSEYRIWRFDSNGKQTHRVSCMLPRGQAANAFARMYFASDRLDGPPVLPLISYLIEQGTVCFLDTVFNYMECDGQICTEAASLRAPMEQRATGDSAVTSVGDLANSGTAWQCPDGGMLALNGNGTLTYFPPGGGGGGGGGGSGNPCGGGGGGDDDDGDGTVDPPGGGGGASTRWTATCDTLVFQTPDEALYCPSSHPKCLDSLTTSMRNKVLLAVGFADMSDPDCAAAYNAIYNLLQMVPHRVFRGDVLVPDIDAVPHDGATTSDRRIVHIDTDFLSLATPYQLGALLLHEGWHVVGGNGDHIGDGFPYENSPPYNKGDACVAP